MAVAVIVESSSGTSEAYERVREQLGPERPAGGIFRVAGPGPNGGWRVFEVWDSEEAADRFFRERFAPALAAVGWKTSRRELWQVHEALR